MRDLIAVLSRDVRRNREAAPGESAGLGNLLSLRMLAVVLFRVSAAAGRRTPLLGAVVKQLNQLITGADIGWRAAIGPGLVLFHPVGVVIGPWVRIGSDASIQSGVTLGGGAGVHGGRDDSPSLGDRVALGPGARVLGPVIIGDDVQVGANAVVLKDVPANAFAYGVPASWRAR